MAKAISAKGIVWPAFVFQDTSKRFTISFDDEAGKWILKDGDKIVTRRKRILGLVAAGNEYVAAGGKPKTKETKEE